MSVVVGEEKKVKVAVTETKPAKAAPKQAEEKQTTKKKGKAE